MTFLFAFFSIPFYVGSTWILKEISIFYKGSIPFFQTQPLNSLWTNFCGLFFAFLSFVRLVYLFVIFFCFILLTFIYIYILQWLPVMWPLLVELPLLSTISPPLPSAPQNSGLKVSIYLKLIFDNIGPLRIHIWMSGQGTRTSGRFYLNILSSPKRFSCVYLFINI